MSGAETEREESREDGFDELLRAAVADSSQASPRRRGLGALVAALAAVLLGAAGLGVGLLLVQRGAHAEPVRAAAAPAEAPAGIGADAGSGAGDAAPPVGTAASGNSGPGVDPAWLARTAAAGDIPPRALRAYAEAAQRLSAERPQCGLGWNTLAAIGQVESGHGTIHGSALNGSGRAVPSILGPVLDGTSTDAIPDTDGGRLDGDAVWDRAVGPMQFIPGTWAEWGSDGDGDGAADPQQIDDAAYSAARYLCAAGSDLRRGEEWIRAVAAYNDTVEYNNRVAEAANAYAALAG